MAEPIKNVQPKQSQSVQQKQAKTVNKTKNEPSIGDLLINRTATVALTPIAATAGVLTLVGGALNGLVNPDKTFDQCMSEGIHAAGQGADMLEKMWEGRYF